MLEGGGVKNIALLGAVTVLAEAGYTFPRVAGTSGGAIIAAGVAAYQKAGRDLGGLLDVSLRVDKPRFLAWRRPGRVSGSVSGAVDLLRRGGLHSGDYLYEFLCPALEDVDRDHGQSGGDFLCVRVMAAAEAAGEGVEVLAGPVEILGPGLVAPVPVIRTPPSLNPLTTSPFTVDAVPRRTNPAVYSSGATT